MPFGRTELMSLAAQEATALGHRWLGSGHFLLALVCPALEGSAADDALQACSVDRERLSAELVRMDEAGGRPLRPSKWAGVLTNPEAHQVMGFASGVATGFGEEEEVSPEHVLLAILWQPEVSANSLLERIGIARGDVVEQLERLGTSLPGVALPEPPPWARIRWGKKAFVPIEQMNALTTELSRLLPPSATYSFNHDGEKEAWFQASEEVDLGEYISFALDAWDRRKLGCPCCGCVALWATAYRAKFSRASMSVTSLQERAAGTVRAPLPEEVPPRRKEAESTD